MIGTGELLLRHKNSFNILRKLAFFSIFSISVSADTLSIALYDFPPCVVLTKDKEPTGFDIECLETVLKNAGLQVRYSYPEKFSDLLNGVNRGKYDGAVSGITITGEREAMVDFTHPYLNSGLSILVNAGSKVNPFRTIFRYMSNVGPQLLIVLIFTALFGVLIFFIEKIFARKESQFSPDNPLLGIFNGYYFANVANTTMGFGDFVPKSIPGKLLTIVMAIIGIYFILPYATASMNMALQQEQEVYSINSPENLPGKLVATEEGTTSESYLRNIGCNVQAVKRIEDAYDLLGQNKVEAVVFDMPTIMYFVKNKGKNKFRVSGQMFDRQTYGFALKNGSPYREKLNEALADFMRTDAYWELHKKWFGEE
jgi:polar amino acid transport system substrate-binding protein